MISGKLLLLMVILLLVSFNVFLLSSELNGFRVI